jgi:putative spermidine/putrescine transport system substrate-binding protein
MRTLWRPIHVQPLLLLGAIAALVLGSPGIARPARPFEGEVIRVQVWGGPEGEMIQKHVAKSFEETTGAKVVLEFGYTSASVAKLRAQKNDPQLDLVLFDDIGVITAGREGLLDSLDYAKIPNAADIPKKYVFDDKGIGLYVYLNALAYSKEAVKEPPRSWRVLWEPRYKGKVILPAIDATSIFKILIMASLLNGGDQKNMEPGFAAMARLKPNIHSLEKNTAVIAENLRTGEAAIAAWQVAIMKPYVDQGYPVGVTIQLEEGIFGTPGCVSIVKGHKAKRATLEAFINRVLSPEAQAGYMRDFWHSPTNRKVSVPREFQHVALPPEGSPVKLVPVDLDHFYQARGQWLDRLNKTLLQ